MVLKGAKEIVRLTRPRTRIRGLLARLAEKVKNHMALLALAYGIIAWHATRADISVAATLLVPSGRYCALQLPNFFLTIGIPFQERTCRSG